MYILRIRVSYNRYKVDIVKFGGAKCLTAKYFFFNALQNSFKKYEIILALNITNKF